MTKKEIHDELIRVRTELVIYKRDIEKCKQLEEEHQRLRKALANLLIEEKKQEENELNKVERGIK